MSTQQEIGEHLDLSGRQVRNLMRAGILPRSRGRGTNDLDACRKSYITYLRSRSGAAGKPADGAEKDSPATTLEIEKARLAKATADQTELKVLQMKRELAPVALLEWTLSKIAVQIGAILDAVPLKIKRRVPALTTGQVDLIRTEVTKAMNIAASARVDLSEYEAGN